MNPAQMVGRGSFDITLFLGNDGDCAMLSIWNVSFMNGMIFLKESPRTSVSVQAAS